jgi:hypothetical protein
MRPSWTNVLIDGMDANDPVFGYSPAGASGLFLGLDDFAEGLVLTHTVGPEYGTYGGGVIEATTKSGTNQYHGSLFELHRDASLDAKNYFDLGNAPIPPFVRNQFGASIGGPVVHDRTFFFASYEGFREVQASTALRRSPMPLLTRACCPLPAILERAAIPTRVAVLRSDLAAFSWQPGWQGGRTGKGLVHQP